MDHSFGETQAIWFRKAYLLQEAGITSDLGKWPAERRERVAGRHNNVKVGVASPVDEDGVGVAVGCVTCDEIKRLGPRVSLCIVYQIERMGKELLCEFKKLCVRCAVLWKAKCI